MLRTSVTPFQRSVSRFGMSEARQSGGRRRRALVARISEPSTVPRMPDPSTPHASAEDRPGSLRTRKRHILTRLARQFEYPLGVNVAVAAQAATGFPSDVDGPTLRQRLAERQKGAAAVWLSFLGADAVGHALVATVGEDHPTWGPIADAVVASARAEGRLVELGGLSVHPAHHRKGIAADLQSHRLTWAATRGLLPVAAAWDRSAGSTTLCARAGRAVGRHPDYPITLYCLDRL